MRYTAEELFTWEEIAELANVLEHEVKATIAELKPKSIEVYNVYNAGMLVRELVKKKIKNHERQS